MKISNMRSLRRIQFLRWGERIASSGAAVIDVKRRAPVECCAASCALRQLIWRVKSRWKQALKCRRSSVRLPFEAFRQAIPSNCRDVL
ncbi:hypothetical protein L1049_004099 [Liquidambar formosana]|uniref:Uncharacterized protein n=1 Tax=Liquidambar formosana TaxID=63359 RepID=A0AAP0RMV1_LIQFO